MRASLRAGERASSLARQKSEVVELALARPKIEVAQLALARSRKFSPIFCTLIETMSSPVLSDISESDLTSSTPPDFVCSSQNAQGKNE